MGLNIVHVGNNHMTLGNIISENYLCLVAVLVATMHWVHRAGGSEVELKTVVW